LRSEKENERVIKATGWGHVWFSGCEIASKKEEEADKFTNATPTALAVFFNHFVQFTLYSYSFVVCKFGTSRFIFQIYRKQFLDCKCKRGYFACLSTLKGGAAS
jgi:hypothetical protein